LAAIEKSCQQPGDFLARHVSDAAGAERQSEVAIK
jgi:hypothetical protein